MKKVLAPLIIALGLTFISSLIGGSWHEKGKNHELASKQAKKIFRKFS